MPRDSPSSRSSTPASSTPWTWAVTRTRNPAAASPWKSTTDSHPSAGTTSSPWRSQPRSSPIYCNPNNSHSPTQPMTPCSPPRSCWPSAGTSWNSSPVPSPPLRSSTLMPDTRGKWTHSSSHSGLIPMRIVWWRGHSVCTTTVALCRIYSMRSVRAWLSRSSRPTRYTQGSPDARILVATVSRCLSKLPKYRTQWSSSRHLCLDSQ